MVEEEVRHKVLLAHHTVRAAEEGIVLGPEEDTDRVVEVDIVREAGIGLAVEQHHRVEVVADKDCAMEEDTVAAAEDTGCVPEEDVGAADHTDLVEDTLGVGRSFVGDLEEAARSLVAGDSLDWDIVLAGAADTLAGPHRADIHPEVEGMTLRLRGYTRSHL